MDRIIKGYLKRFVTDFGFDESEEDRNFERFCHYAILKNELNFFDDNDLDDVSVGKNKGIDGICISIDGNKVTTLSEIEDLRDSRKNFDVTIFFFQAKTSSKFEDNELANFCDSVLNFLSEKPKHVLTQEAKNFHQIFLGILNLMSYLKSFNCKLFYCSTGTWNLNTSTATTLKIKEEQLKNLKIFKNDLLEINPIDNENLRKLFDKANSPLDTEFIFSQKVSLRETPGVKESFIGILPFEEFRKIIIDKESGDLKPLFYDNVRDFLGLDEDVNISINKTLQDHEFELFQFLNNGITIISEENKGRGDKFLLVNYQVINGCQTSNVLFINKDLEGIQGIFIPVKLIITTDQDIRDKIIVSSNNQNQIKEEQLLALTSFQKGLERFYCEMDHGLRYERRKSQYAFELNITKKSIVDIREQIKSYVSMFLEEPHVVSGYFGKVYKERNM